MAKVFVTQEIRADFRQAREHGDLVFLTSMDQDFTNNSESRMNPELVEQLRHGLRDFNDGEDWVILTGSPYVNAVVMLILGHRMGERARFLRWDNRDFRYIPLNIDLAR